MGQEAVYINGVLQVRGSDYTATDGSSVVLTSPLVANNVVQVISAVAYAVANVIPGTTITTKGDLVTGSAIGTPTRLPIGTNNSFLVADSTQATGIRWSTNGGTFTTWRKAAAGGETTLTGTDDFALTLAYTAGQEMVYINGVLLERGVDYTASNGTTVTGLTALVAGDVATVVTIGTFQIPNAIQLSQVTAKGDLLAATGSGTVTNLAVGADGTTLVANSASATGVAWAGPSVAAGKNVVINGAFDFWQRNTSYTMTGGWAYGAADRWGFQQYPTGLACVVARSTDVPTGAQYSIKIQRSTSSTNTSSMGILQCIESVNVIPLQGKTVTLSFWAKAGANFSGTTLNAKIQTGTAADEVIGFANGSYTGNVVAGNTSPTITTTWTRYTLTATLATNIQEMSINLNWAGSALAAGADDSVFIANVQLEIGSVATTFSRAQGTIQGELAACQRYYFRYGGNAVYEQFGNGQAWTTTNSAIQIKSPVSMRTNPTSVDYANLYVGIYGAAGGGAVTSLTQLQGSRDVHLVQANVASGFTANQFYVMQANNSTSAYIGFSAEL